MASNSLSFWQLALANRSQVLRAWDWPAAAGLTFLALLVVELDTLKEALPELLVVEAGLLAGLLGVLIAGFAIIIVFLHRDFVRILARTKGGVVGDFFPFWYIAALAAVAILASGSGVLLVHQATEMQLRILFGVTTFLSSYTLFALVNVVGFITLQGTNRATQLLSDSYAEQANSMKPGSS